MAGRLNIRSEKSHELYRLDMRPMSTSPVQGTSLMEIRMFRRIALAAIAAASIAAIAPTAASAHGMGGHGFHGGGYHGGHWGHGFRHSHFYRSSFYVGRSCYKTVFTEFGPRRVNVCGTY
jgi:hypothetical protein